MYELESVLGDKERTEKTREKTHVFRRLFGRPDLGRSLFAVGVTYTDR